MKGQKFLTEIYTDNLQAAMHFYQHARRHGCKVIVTDFTDEEDEPKEVAHFDGIHR